MNFINFILKALGLVKINSKDNYEKNFIKFSEEKDKFTNKELFFCNYIDNSKLFTNDKIYILDIGCSEGADEIFTKFNFFSFRKIFII